MGLHEQGRSRLTKWKSLADELNSGQASAARLQVLMKDNLSKDNCSSAAELLAGVMSSFSKSLLLVAMEIIAAAPLANAKPPSSGEQKSESPSWKRKRSCSRARANPNTSRTVVSKGIEDGYRWRKYGQKMIFGASHQRSYYRCKHKYERGCQAIRKVQGTPEDASMFEIIYIGEHTCELEANETTPPPCVISLEQGIEADGGQEAPLSSTDPRIKRDLDEQVLIHLSHRGGASSELMKFQGLSDIQAPAPMPHSRESSEHYDETSEFRSSAMELEADIFSLSDILDKRNWLQEDVY